jgi:hypothetical protein
MIKLFRTYLCLGSVLILCAASSLAEKSRRSGDTADKSRRSGDTADKFEPNVLPRQNKNARSPTGGPFPPLTCDALSAGPVTSNVRFVNDIYPLLINNCPTAGGCGFATCANCHGGPATAQNRFVINAGSADFTLLTLLDTNRDWIVPLRPELSRLYRHINCNLTTSGIWRMPLVGNPMSINQQALIYDWIKQGARGTFEGVNLSDVVFIDGLESRRR